MLKITQSILFTCLLSINAQASNQENSDSMLDIFKSKLSNVKKMAQTTLDETMSQTKTSISTTVDDYYSDLEIMIPFINKLGYSIGKIDVAIGLPPTILVQLKRDIVVSIKDQEAVIKYCEYQGLSTTILSTIVEASKLQQNMHFGEFQFKELELVLSIIPSAVIRYYPKS